MTTSATLFSAPKADEYNEYYTQYISKFSDENFLERFQAQTAELRSTLGNLPEGEESKLHAPYTWSLKQVVGHLIDCERIFSTRLLRIGVGDETPIPGIDQNLYVDNMEYSSVSMESLLDEFEHLRLANVALVKRMTPESLARRGVASGNPVSANANLFILGGHVVYHLEIVKKRLGLET